MESAAVPAQTGGDGEETGLKAGALGLASGVVIGVDSTAPAYSLAAVIAALVVAAGVQTPGIMLLAFVPMLCVAAAYYFMNRVDPDCGTTFAWVTRAMGPTLGWVAGWSILSAGIIVIGSLADIAALYTYLLFDWSSAAESKEAVMGLAVFYIISMTWIAIRGIELSARTQFLLITLQVVALIVFAVVALVKVASGDATSDSVDPALSWFSPFATDGGLSAITAGLLIGIFIYWGWDSAVAVNEETEDATSNPGRAALISVVVLLGIYLLTSTALVAYAGPGLFEDFLDDPAIFDTIAADALGSDLGKIVVVSILSSALAATQTTILPASRTSLSMARMGALPKVFGAIHPRFQTPHTGTAIVAGMAIAFYVIFNAASQNFLFDAITALGFLIAWNYGFNGAACVVYHRRELTRSWKNFVYIGLAPGIGAAFLGFIFVKAAIDYSDPAQSYLGTEWLGVAPPAFIGIGLVIVGFVLGILWRLFGNSTYYDRKPEVAAPGEVAGLPTIGA